MLLLPPSLLFSSYSREREISFAPFGANPTGFARFRDPAPDPHVGFFSQEAMAVMERTLWGGLPGEIIERVLSFLPVPVLCRFRCVCKRWNGLVNKPSFHDLCDTNGRKENYLFVTRYVIYSDWCYVDPNFIRTLSFLDLPSRRWYTIRDTVIRDTIRDTTAFKIGLDTRLLAMDDGLLCDLTTNHDSLPGTPIVVFDPVARMRTTLRAPPTCCPTDALPLIVMVADNLTRSYRVFFLNNCAVAETRMFVYDSARNKWRAVTNPSIGVSAALSAVFFRGELYVVFQTDAWNRYVILSYTDDAWTPIAVRMPEKPSHPQLVATGGRLFLMVWSFTRVAERGCVTANSSYEVIEIRVAENASKRVLQITTAHLQESFDEELVDIAYGIPWFDAAGECCSVILVSSLSGKLINYNLVSGVVDALPAHPLRDSSLDEVDSDGLPVYASYAGKHMTLSLRGLLSHGGLAPKDTTVATTGCRGGS